MNHTPTPWDYFKGNANGKGLIRIESGIDARPSGVHISSLTRSEENEANAELIVIAVNNHKNLVETLRYVEEILVIEKNLPQTLRKVREALAKAGVK